MTDQAQFIQFATTRPEFDAARGHLLRDITRLIRSLRSAGEPSPRAARMRHDIGLEPELSDPREQVMRRMTMQGIHF